MTRHVFISYRRGDTADWAGRLYDHFRQKIGEENVFLDVQQIAPGANFVRALENEVDRSDAVVLLIGPRWLSGSAETGTNRLADPDDFVRREVERAIASGVPIVPVLVAGARMPATEDLPGSVRQIVDLPRMELREPSFEADAELILRRISQRPRRPDAQAQPGDPSQRAIFWSITFVCLCFGFWVAAGASSSDLSFDREAAVVLVAATLIASLVLAKRIQSLQIYCVLLTASLTSSFFAAEIVLRAALNQIIGADVRLVSVRAPSYAYSLPALGALVAVALQAATIAFLFLYNRKRLRSTATRERRLMAGNAEFEHATASTSTRILLVSLDSETEPMLGRVQSRLRGRFGKDTMVIAASEGTYGQEPTPQLEPLKETDVVLVLIGSLLSEGGVGAVQSAQRRGWVQSALTQALGAGAHVTPLLLDGAQMLDHRRLPEDLRELSWRNATPLRHSQFDTDIEHVIAMIEDRRALVRDFAAGFGRRKTRADIILEKAPSGLARTFGDTIRAAAYSIPAGFAWFLGMGITGFGQKYGSLHAPNPEWMPLALLIFVGLTGGAIIFPLRNPQERSWIVFLAMFFIFLFGLAGVMEAASKSIPAYWLYDVAWLGNIGGALGFIIILGSAFWFLGFYVYRNSHDRRLDRDS